MATPTRKPMRTQDGNGKSNGKEQPPCCAKTAQAEQPKQAKKTTAPVHVPAGHSKTTAPSNGKEPTAQQIAERAYLIWELQGRQHGKDQENWLEAERQLRQEMGCR